MDWYVSVLLCFLRSKFDIGKRSESEMLEEHDEAMRSQYHDPIERFPDKTDQLLSALNRVIA